MSDSKSQPYRIGMSILLAMTGQPHREPVKPVQYVEMIVLTVGREYVWIGRDFDATRSFQHRFRKDDSCRRIIDSPNDRMFAVFDREEFEQMRKLEALWKKFQRQMQGMYQLPRGITIEKIEQVAALLGINLKEAP